jgi:O-antigen/teichoic acid export membrane protein
MSQPNNTSDARSEAQTQMKKGFAWFGSSALVVRLIELASTLIVLRLLDKSDFGQASVVISIVLIVEAMSGAGLGTSIVQASSLNAKQINSLFWLCMAVACGLSLIIASNASFVAIYYNDPELKRMLLISSTKMIFVGASVVPLQLLARDMRFRESSLVQASATLLESFTRVWLAATGFGAWALIYANVARGVFICIAAYAVRPLKPTFHFAKEEVQPFVHFGLRAAIASLLTQCYRHIDYLLVGKFLGLSAVGLYRVAYEVALTAVEVITQLVNRVVYPVFSSVSNDKNALLPVFFDANRYLWMLIAPIVVAVFFNPEAIILAFAGQQWVNAATATKLLSWAALMHASSQQFSMLFYAQGRPDYVVKGALLTLLTISISITVTLTCFPDLSINGAALAWLVSYPMILFVLMTMAKRLLPFTIPHYLKNLLPIAAALVFMAVIVQILLWTMAWSTISRPVAAGLSSTIGIFSYILFLYFSPKIRQINLKPNA